MTDSSVTEKPNSSQNGKNIYRKGAKDAKEILNFLYLTIESLELLCDLRAFEVPRCWFRFVRVRGEAEKAIKM
jgi:hypothetical protein